MKKVFLYLLGLFIFVKCSIGFGCDYRLSFMSHKELKFKELPTKMQECLTDKKRDSLYAINVYKSILVFDNAPDRYQVESVPFGPWIQYIKLIDTKRDVVYRIERIMPRPYIIYDGKLYIASQFSYELDKYLRETTFSEYKLK